LATTDPGQISRWWGQFPEAIPAICCSDFVVIDADRHPGGQDGVAALAALAKQHGDWPDHPVALTPSIGEHHYFGQTHPPLGNRTGELPDGIDVRGIGGFVIGPGALLPDGFGWRMAPAHSTDLPQLPPWLERMLRAEVIPVHDHDNGNGNGNGSSSVSQREERYAKAALEAGVDEIRTAPNGKRNTVLNSVAFRLGRMIARGWIDRNKVENCLLHAAFQLKNEDGLTAVLATIKSGLDAGLRKPHPDLVNRNWGGK
jgi:hypothetical protein